MVFVVFLNHFFLGGGGGGSMLFTIIACVLSFYFWSKFILPQNGQYGKTGVSMINLTTLIFKIRTPFYIEIGLSERKKKSTFLMKIGILKTPNYQNGLSRVNKTILYGLSTHFYIRKGFIKTHHQNLWWK